MKKSLLCLILTAVLLFSLVGTVAAEEAAAPKTFPEGYVEHKIDGMAHLAVTSSHSFDLGDNFDTSALFDSNKLTGTIINFDEAEGKSLTLYTASRECEKLEMFSLLLSLSEGAELKITVYGSNDSTLTEWKELPTEKLDNDGDFTVYKITEGSDHFAFYRFDFSMENGGELALAEMNLFRLPGSNDVPATPNAAQSLYGREQWRVVRSLFKHRV